MENRIPWRRNALTGYLHPDYAASLTEFGRPRALPLSRGWLLERQIPETADKDAIGCYPLFCCTDWSQLADDLAPLERELVSVSMVTDPFGAFDLSALQRCFPDMCRPFKQHFIVDLRRPVFETVSPHHARNVRRSRGLVEVEVCEAPERLLEEWLYLYAMLIERHQIRGVAAFSRRSFEVQLNVPGIVAFRAIENAVTVGMLLWYVQNEIGYYHLGAYSPRGYELRVSYALFSHAIEHFHRSRIEHLSLGAGAGLGSSTGDGLTRFKRGWATGTRTAHLCGRVLDRKRYDDLARLRGAENAGYFPAYRCGEFIEASGSGQESS